MSLIEKITKEEMDTITFYRKNFSCLNEGEVDSSRFADSEYVLRSWANAKSEYLYKMLGERLIYEREITMEEPLEEMEDRIIKDFPFWRSLLLDKIVTWMRTQSNEIYRWGALDFATNHMRATWQFNNGLRINKGTKPMKALATIMKNMGDFITEEDWEAYEQLRLTHSRILNTKEFKGTLCISIHPLDYMTMSDNNNDWTSCMSWQNEGEYRQGTVEMMNSPCVVVAYLKSQHDMFISRENTWNNKKWRCLFVVTPDVITSIKSYPYHNDFLVTNSAEIIGKLVQDNLEWTYQKTFKNEKESDVFINEYDYIFYTRTMYNDFDRGNTISGYANPFPFGQEPEKIYYSGDTECMWCGEIKNNDDFFLDEGHERMLVCDKCEYHAHCACCGCDLYEDDICYIDGEAYCYYCADDLLVWDDILGEMVRREEDVSQYIIVDEQKRTYDIITTTVPEEELVITRPNVVYGDGDFNSRKYIPITTDNMSDYLKERWGTLSHTLIGEWVALPREEY